MKNKGTLLLLQFFNSQRVYMCLLLVIHVRAVDGCEMVPSRMQMSLRWSLSSFRLVWYGP